MKAKELNSLNLKDFLPVVYPDIEPHLMKELNRLRDELAALPEATSKEELLSKFEFSINKLNEIDADESIDSGIDTEERESLCDALTKLGTIVGLEEDDGYIDQWRDW